MTTRQIAAPTALPVDLARAKDNLRIDLADTTMDSMIEAWLRGIADHAEHYLGRSIMNQTWRVTLDSFPSAIRLDHPPIVSVQSVKYVDDTGVERTLSPLDYVVDTFSEPGYLVPTDGKAWPATVSRINAVSVDYTAGYGATPATVPESVKLYILAKLVEAFDPATRPEKDTVQSSFLDHLLDRHRLYA